MPTRYEQFNLLFPQTPAYRWRQIEAALFNPAHHAFADITSLPADWRAQLATQIPWLSVSELKIFESKNGDTYKAVVACSDGARIETVLMRNRRDAWTICVSSQVGCAMGCSFCATGRMGLIRNLTADEIVDQYRFWRQWLQANNRTNPAQGGGASERISNIVFMGMGEPLANYDVVKHALRTLLQHTDLGPTHITVSSVGVLPFLNRILTDNEWPPVRMAISLHSARPEVRKSIVPTTVVDFLPKLAQWTKDYFAAFPGRRRHVTFEYILLENINDRLEDARALGRFAASCGHVRINIIPYNSITESELHRSSEERIEQFIEQVVRHGVQVTRRKTMGDDIAAACGQLVTMQA